MIAGSTNPGRLYSLAEMPVPMVFAAHRIIRDCNAPFAELFGYERQEVIGLSFRRLYPEVGEFVRIGRQWSAQLKSEGVYFDERIMLRKDGSRLWCRVHGRSSTPDDPLAEAIYCFEPMHRGVTSGDIVLTGRQREILALISQGLTSAEIGRTLSLSPRTVESHRARLIARLALRNSAELIAWFNERETGTHRVAGEPRRRSAPPGAATTTES